MHIQAAPTVEEAFRLEAALADARAARETMADFVDTVVHDLRSPLAVIRGYCSLMLEGSYGAVPRSWQYPLDTVEVKVRECQRLVDQLLLAARLEGGTIPVSAEELDLAALAEEAVTRAEPQARLVEASVLTAAPERRVRAWADKRHVEQIVDNLVNNALAYSGGAPRVEVSAGARGGPEIAVSDWGPGIEPERRARIFDRFFRGDESVPGSGLGLYVSRQLARANRGRLELDRRWPHGSRFVLSLPPPMSASGNAFG